MRIAKILGEHIGCELVVEPISRMLNMTVHFLSHPDCPLCLEEFEKKC